MNIKRGVLHRLVSLFLLIVIIPLYMFQDGVQVNAASTKGTIAKSWISGYYFDFSGVGLPCGNHKGQASILTVNGKPAYCIELGEQVHTGSYTFQDAYNKLTVAERTLLKNALVYGYTGKSKYGYSKNVEYYATQILCWTIENGYYNHTSKSTEIFNAACKTNPDKEKIKKCISKMREQIDEHKTIPSFTRSTAASALTQSLKFADGKYTLTLTDNKGAAKYYDWSDFKNSGITVSISGNKVTFTANKSFTGVKTLKATRVKSKYLSNITEIAPMYLASGTNQDLVVDLGYANDPVPAYLKLQVPTGNLEISKVSEDGKKSGFKFQVKGNEFEKTLTTGSDGTATVKDLPTGTSYTVKEVSVDNKYVVPDQQIVNVSAASSATVKFENKLKKWRATLTKSDAETGTAQGDASLAGAKYGVYQGDQLIDTYVTDEDGQFVTDYYVCGSDWSIRELTPSSGYLLNDTSYHVGAEPGLYELEYNDTAVDVTEQVIKGKISLLKHTDDGSTGIETPEEGAEFQIFLRSAGSYDKARDSERDILTCDEHGYAESRELPYGWYTVHQTKGWDGRELLDDFDVFISKDGEVYRYLLNNANFESRVKIVKKDAETGNTVPQAGHGYQLYDPQGKLITMTVTYPEIVKINTFYTDSNGYLITPEPLPYGKGYSIVEVETVEPYILDSTPVYFDITQEASEEQDGITVIKVEKANMPQKGVIDLYKEGEVFSSVFTTGGEEAPLLYQPVYEKTGLAGGEYDVVAAEDISSGGVLRYSKGDIVTKLTTGPDGHAKSAPLYLGTYQIIERKAPEGMVLDPEPVTVTLSYAGQHVELTEAPVQITDERQKAQIDLTKALEQDELFGIGMNGEIRNVAWGLYAAEEIKAADGSVIPKDGLLELIHCDEAGKAVFTTDIPIGSKLYVQEYATDNRYVISDQKYPVEFSYQGQDAAIVHIHLNDGKPIENKLIRGDIDGRKVNKDGGAVAGAVFGLFRPDETEFSLKTALITAESDQSGAFSFRDIPYGEWVIKELSCPPQYLLSGELFHVTVREEAEHIEIEAVNQWITGSVQTTKVDAQYPDHKLSGAVFAIYRDVNGNQVYDEGIDPFVEHLTEIEPGVYRLDGLKYHGYFLYEESAPAGYIRDTRYYYFEITDLGETVVVENQAGTGFVNQPEETTDVPKTGDDANLWLWIGLASCAAVGLVTLAVIQIRRRKKQ